MQTGQNDQRIYFESPTESNDGGELTRGWTPVGYDWAMVISQRGSEAFEAARENARETIRLRLRFRTDVLVTWRMTWMGQVYHLKHVDRTQHRKGELWLTAELVGAE